MWIIYILILQKVNYKIMLFIMCFSLKIKIRSHERISNHNNIVISLTQFPVCSRVFLQQKLIQVL